MSDLPLLRFAAAAGLVGVLSSAIGLVFYLRTGSLSEMGAAIGATTGLGLLFACKSWLAELRTSMCASPVRSMRSRLVP